MHQAVANIGRWRAIGLAALLVAVVAVPAAAAMADEAAASLTAEQTDKARNVFLDWSCGACHTLADGEGAGQIGPSFDGNAALTREKFVDRVTNGQGAMPGFGGQIPDEEIALLADYVMQVKK
jgi:mono/diheme cytochrome c family protein